MIVRARVELQYIVGCPNVPAMKDRLAQAVRGIEDRVEIIEIVVGDEEIATNMKFRGSPTLLVNGEDVSRMSEPVVPALSCRIYRDGLPSADHIRRTIENAL
jgi:protein-disulfide isomerase